ncbi:uncharacterized protein LOC117193106 [Drosophila miranda]|uniref:uncharacterized protein LOC117193106 n=1 Tax=Drosophila miranda TaxID=7229 RepID=UPI00143F06EC|nr:uncharacterized protein LOC117193106 [Drosophila miranda]
MRSKKPVWLLFKVLELVLSFCCCYIHWRCFQDEGIPHIFLLCDSYGGSSIICLLAIIGMFYAEKPTMQLESAFSGLFCTLHLVTIFVHMYLALHGNKLLYLKRGPSPLKLYFISKGFRWFHLLTANMLMSTQPSQKTLDVSSNSNEAFELTPQLNIN